MGTTFVTIDGQHGFWMRDWLLELWLRLLALHVEDPPEPDPRITEIRDTWLLASRGFFGGCVPHDLKTFASDDEGRRLIRHALDSLMTALTLAPPEIDHSGLGLLGLDPSAAGSIETWRLLEVGQAFRDLLDGRIDSLAGDKTAVMPGHPRSLHRR